MTDHTSAFGRNTLLSVPPPPELSQLRPRSMRLQRVNGQGLHDAGKRIEPVLCVEQSFASMITVADTDADLLRTAVVLLVRGDELVRERLSERLSDPTEESVP